MSGEMSFFGRVRLLVLVSALACTAAAGATGTGAGNETETETDTPAPPLLNLVQNGDFELGPSRVGGPAMWSGTRAQKYPDDARVAWDDSVARSGKHSVSIEIGEDHPEEKVLYSWNQYILGYVVGATYRVSAWVRTQNVNESAFLVVQCWDRGMTEVLGVASTEDSSTVVGTSDWTEISATITVPAETGRMSILLGFSAAGKQRPAVWITTAASKTASSEVIATQPSVGWE